MPIGIYERKPRGPYKIGRDGRPTATLRWEHRLKELPRSVEKWTDSPCLHWDGAFFPSGYGAGRGKGRTMVAHRMTFKLFYGRYPAKFACHHCDNKWCVNPLHLFEGGPAENSADAVAKGRTLKGIHSTGHKYRKVDPGRIRDLLKAGCFQRDIAKWLGICQQHVSLVNLGKFRGIDANAT